MKSNLLKVLNKIKAFIFLHKKLSIFILILVLGGSYFSYKKFSNNNSQSYVLTKIMRETLEITVSGSGYVSSENQIQLKSKVSGNVVYLGAKNGDYVYKGQLTLKIDDRDIQNTITNAEISLENAKIALEKLKKPPEENEILQAQNSLEQAKLDKSKIENNLKLEYENTIIRLNQAFKDIPNIIENIKKDLFTLDISNQYFNIDFFTNLIQYSRPEVSGLKNNVYYYYEKAKNSYNEAFNYYKDLTKDSPSGDIEKTLNLSYEITKYLSETLKNAISVLEIYRDFILKSQGSGIDYVYTLLNNLNSYLSIVNTNLNNLNLSKTNISQLKNSLNLADQTINLRQEQLNRLLKGPDELDIKSQELIVKQKENDLLNAKQKLNDYYIYSPISGYIGQINVKVGEEINAGTIIGVISGKEKIAEINLNEVDVANVKIGDQVKLSLDAIPGKTFKGKVIEVDPIGTVEQGVVSYKVKILFENASDEVKDGMSVDVEIIVERKENVVLAPNQSIKSLRNQKYIEVVKENVNFEKDQNQKIINYQPNIERRFIKTGLTNDEYTEVLEGLNEGEIIVLRTISNNQTSNNQQRNIFQFGGSGQFRGIRTPGIRQ